MDPQQALLSGFQPWVEHVTGPNENSKVPPGVRLDPYGSSMRLSKQIPASLVAIESGTPLAGVDWTQRVSDLRGARLCAGAAADASLTPLGRDVLAKWRSAGVDNDSDDDELPRAIVLARTGVIAGDELYGGAAELWRRLRGLRAPDEWFADPFALHMVSYLNQADTNGYNPFEVLAALGFPFSGGAAAWAPIAAALPTPAGWTTKHPVTKLVDTAADYARRPAGRVAFAQALELLHLYSTRPELVSGTLDRWGVV